MSSLTKDNPQDNLKDGMSSVTEDNPQDNLPDNMACPQ